MKTLIFLFIVLTLGSFGVLAETQIDNQDKSIINASPRYIFNDKLAALESIVMTPSEVEINQFIQFDLKLIGLEDLTVAMYYVTSDAKEYFLTELENLGNGSHSGRYQVPEVEFGTYTQFRAIASTVEKQQELITGIFPGITVVSTPNFTAQLTPLAVSIDDSILFSAQLIGLDVSSVEIHYDVEGQRFPVTNLTLQSSEPNKQTYAGEFTIPGGIPAGDYNGFVALANESGTNKVFQANLEETVTLDTNCASANITVNDDSGVPTEGAKVSIGSQSATTDAQGQATLTGLQDNTEQTVVVTALDFMPTEANVNLSCLEIAETTLILTPTTKDCSQLDVNVVDNSKGESEPIAGATVMIASQSAITDEMGNVNLTEVLEGVNTLTTTAVDFVEDQREVSLSCAEPTQATVILEPIIKNCATLNVLVTDRFDEPIRGASVTIPHKGINGSAGGITGASGSLNLTELRENSDQVEIMASGYGPVQNPISLDCIEPVSITIVLDDCANVIFDVFSLDGTERFSISGAQVSVTDSNAMVFEQTTGESGRVTFSAFNPGTHSYTITRPGFDSVSSAFSISECRSNSEDIITIEVPLSGSIN